MKRKLFVTLVSVLVLTLALSACGGGTTAEPEEPMVEPTEEPMVEPTEEPMEEPTEKPPEELVLAYSSGKPAVVLLQDDFDDSSSGWELQNLGGGSTGYKDSSYFIIAHPDWGVWGRINQSFYDFVIELDATPVEAPEDNQFWYGVVCRNQGIKGHDGDGYWFIVGGDGKYAIINSGGGEDEELVELTESDVIRQGKATNHLRVVCDGSTLELSVNGERLATVEDSTFEEGDIALFASAGTSGSAEVHFDNLVVSKP
jgi:hypothetical protein